MNEKIDKQASDKGPGNSPSPASSAPAAYGAGGGAGIKNILAGLASALGLGPGKSEEPGGEPGDVGTRLAHRRTDLALNRSFLAAERTLMAWVRTSLSMISFGFTIGKLGQVLENVKVKGILGSIRMISVESIAYFLVVLGTLALLGALLQHRRRMHDLYAVGLRRQFSITSIVALVLAAVGGFALTSLVTAL